MFHLPGATAEARMDQEAGLEDVEDLEEVFEHPGIDVGFYVEGLGILLTGVIGCFINAAAIWRLTLGQGRRKRHTFHYLLISLSVYDLVIISLVP